MSQRRVMLGIVGDSAAGKTTLTKGIAQVLGAENVTVICTDDYHKYDRQQRKDIGISALHPDCNYLDIIQQHLSLLRSGQPILKPIYSHSHGTFKAPEYIKPAQFVIVEGLLGFATRGSQDCFDVKVYLAPPEELRYDWKIKRDTLKRGYNAADVIEQLKQRESDSEAFIRPQRASSDIVVSFYPSDTETANPTGDNSHLNVRLILRPTIPHPELADLLSSDPNSAVRLGLDRDMGKPVDILEIDGNATQEQVTSLEHILCQEVPHLGSFCSLDGTSQVGKLVGTTGEILQSYPLALTQLLIAYHVLKAANNYH